MLMSWKATLTLSFIIHLRNRYAKLTLHTIYDEIVRALTQKYKSLRYFESEN